MSDSRCDDCGPIGNFQPLSMKEVREHSGSELAELAKNFQCTEQEMETVVRELFSDGTTLCHIAHLLAFTEKLIDHHPDEKLKIYESTFKSIACHLRF